MQTVNTVRTRTLENDTTSVLTTNGDYFLDSKDPLVQYGNIIWNIDDGDNKAFASVDSPFEGLIVDYKNVSVRDQYKLYLMYKPDSVGDDSIWVTLRTLEWHWEGSAIKINGVWDLDDEPSPDHSNDPSQLSAILPVWENRIQNLIE